MCLLPRATLHSDSEQIVQGPYLVTLPSPSITQKLLAVSANKTDFQPSLSLPGRALDSYIFKGAIQCYHL